MLMPRYCQLADVSWLIVSLHLQSFCLTFDIHRWDTGEKAHDSRMIDDGTKTLQIRLIEVSSIPSLVDCVAQQHITSNVSHSSKVVLMSPGLAAALPRFVLPALSSLPSFGKPGLTLHKVQSGEIFDQTITRRGRPGFVRTLRLIDRSDHEWQMSAGFVPNTASGPISDIHRVSPALGTQKT